METQSKETIEILKQKGFKRRYEIRFEKNGVVMDFPERFKMKANIAIGSKNYSINRTGWWKRFINIEAHQSPYSKWQIPHCWKGGGEFRTEDNRVFRLKKAGIFSNKWHWFNEREEPVIEYKENQWSFTRKGSVRFLTGVDDTLLWLFAVGWFLIICKQQDAATAAAVT